MNPHEHLIETLAHSEMFANFEWAFEEIVGIPIVLRAVGSWQFPFCGQTQKTSFWCVAQGANGNSARYLQFWESLMSNAMQKACARTFILGLCEIAAPIKLGSQTIGFLQTGPALRKKPTAETFLRAVRHAARLGLDINIETIRRAYFQTQVLSRKRVAAVVSLLEVFSEHLSMFGNRMVVQGMKLEPRIVTSARRFIQDRHRDAITLKCISDAVHMNRFGFCRMFHKVTGFTVTQFVNRARIEDAKELLLDVDLNITEVAFKAGFQSLTHFNRMFKIIVGESPTRYRTSLPAPSGQHSIKPALREASHRRSIPISCRGPFSKGETPVTRAG